VTPVSGQLVPGAEASAAKGYKAFPRL